MLNFGKGDQRQMQQLPKNIAAIQWNNKIKTGLLSISYLVAILVFVVTLLLMVVVPIMLVPQFNLDLQTVLQSQRLQTKSIIIFVKVLFFCIGTTLYFIHRGINDIDKIFKAHKLVIASSAPFYRALENNCIARGITMPALYFFRTNMGKSTVTAAVVQGVSGKSALVVSSSCLDLPQAEQEALAAQTVQRLYTKDTFFLTLFCFMGHFPYHIAGNTNRVAQVILWLPCKAAEAVLSVLRPFILDLRLARLDAGSLELTKDADAMASLLGKLASLEEIEKYFYAPYLSLFISKNDRGSRQKILSKT